MRSRVWICQVKTLIIIILIPVSQPTGGSFNAEGLPPPTSPSQILQESLTACPSNLSSTLVLNRRKNIQALHDCGGHFMCQLGTGCPDIW